MEQITCISNCLSIGIVSLFVTICFLVCRNFLASKAKRSRCECEETIYTGEVTASNHILVPSGAGKVPIFELLQQSDNEESYISPSGTIYRNKACQRCCEDGDSVCESCLSKDRIVILHAVPTSFSLSSAGRTDDRRSITRGPDGRLEQSYSSDEEDNTDDTKAGTRMMTFPLESGAKVSGIPSPVYSQPPAEGTRPPASQSLTSRALSPQESETPLSFVASPKRPISKGREGTSLASPDESQYSEQYPGDGKTSPIGSPKSMRSPVSKGSEGTSLASPQTSQHASETKRSIPSSLSPSGPSTPSSSPQSAKTPAQDSILTHQSGDNNERVPVTLSKGDSSSLAPSATRPTARVEPTRLPTPKDTKDDDDNAECESVCICGEEDTTLTLKGKIKFGCKVCQKKYKCVCTTQASGVATVHEVTIGVKKEDSGITCLCDNAKKGPHGAAAPASASNKTYAGRFIINIKLPKGSTKQ